MGNNQLQQIKQSVMSTGAVKMFRDSLPNASGKQAEKMATRFAKMLYTTIAQNPNLQKCTVPSLLKAASISASLDLDIDPRGLAYLVPYGDKATFQIGYQGLMELAYRSKKVKSISAHCIYESEKDNVVIKRINGKFEVEHPFSYEPPTGKMIAVYATANLEGMDTQTIVLRKSDVEFYRQKSQASNSPAWKNFYEAMAKKTAIRQLAKFLPKSIADDLTRGAAIDEQQDFADSQGAADVQKNAEAGSEIVDAAFEDDSQQEQPQQGVASNETDNGETQSNSSSTDESQNKSNDTGLYLCNDCGHRFNEEPKVKDGCYQCPECGKLHVIQTPF